MPIYLKPEDRLAWNLYREIITLSPPDANGLPTLIMLSDSLRWVESWMHSDLVFELVDKIRTIHAIVLEWRIAELNSRANSK